MDSALILKIVFIFVYWLLSFFSGLLPVKVPALKNSTKWAGISNCFAGGIFLAISLIHLLPEGNEALNEGCGGDCGYPWAFLIGLLGYILILFIEKVAFDAHDMLEGHEHT